MAATLSAGPLPPPETYGTMVLLVTTRPGV